MSISVIRTNIDFRCSISDKIEIYDMPRLAGLTLFEFSYHWQNVLCLIERKPTGHSLLIILVLASAFYFLANA